jgi:ATP-dependent helicase/DNAse subunit B
LIADWDWQLERLAQQLSQGQAEVQPYNQTACQFCDLHGLCRIAAGCELGADDDAGVL